MQVLSSQKYHEGLRKGILHKSTQIWQFQLCIKRKVLNCLWWCLAGDNLLARSTSYLR